MDFDLVATYLFLFIFFIGIPFGIAYLVYTRYYKSYVPEIEDYLTSQGLTLDEIRDPNKRDWKKCPFEQKKKLGCSHATMRFGFVKFSLFKFGYIVVKTNEGKTVWLEIETIYFRKPKLTFSIANKSKN